MKHVTNEEMPETPLVMPAPRALVTALRRIAVALTLAIIIGVLLGTTWTSKSAVMTRTITIALVATGVFALFERWPRRLPRWCARWALQVAAVGICIPITTLAIYVASTRQGEPPFWRVKKRMDGFMMLTAFGVLVAPWTALAALVRQKEAFARNQALAFDLERSELERQALDARLHLLQAQVAPHFLFNTLANVQALVDAGSPRASEVLRSLTMYLRAAVPQLHDSTTTIGREVQLARAYLELMHMRMPDRLQFELHVDSSLLELSCPPTTLLTLVENAVRHGIDPSEEGGRIDIFVQRESDRCLIRVVDSGTGLNEASKDGGTGLTTLRERLRLFFDEKAQLSLERRRHGVTVTVSVPISGQTN
jgi:hypothetical protein